MREITIAGKSVEEAIEKGLQQLGVPREKVQVDVLEEGKTGGIFGIGGKLAQVRLSTEEGQAPEAEAEEEYYPEPSEQEEPEEDQRREQREERPRREEKPAQEATDEAVQRAVDIVRGIVEKMGFEPEITSEKDGSDIAIHVNRAGGALIGRRGQTLYALQYLVNRIFNEDKESWNQIRLDVEDYRKRREKEMLEMAERLYRKVLSNGEQVTVKNLSSQDRRVVHMALKDKDGVETYSKGTGHLRKLIIAPKGGGGRSSRRSRPSRQDNRSRSRSGGGQSSSSSVSNRVRSFTMRLEESEEERKDNE
jgi:spoIIIJ-associated protein